MEHLFKAWPDFAAAIKAAPHVLLLADYDGTLARIVGRPEEAVLSTGVRQDLMTLAKRPDYSVGVISGRQLAEVKALVAIKDIYYSGNHGLEIEGPGLQYINPEAEAARDIMLGLTAQLAQALGHIEGVIIQEKGLSVSVHFRLATPDKEDIVTKTVKRLTAPHVEKGEIRVYPMKKLWEIRPPADWDKGKAVELIGREIKAKLKLRRLLTIYLGDDTTDEDAFKVLRRPDGWSIYVGGEKASSSAAYYLSSVEEVEDFLGRLIGLKKD
jgi:trehalose 6-phosphate phosphatase